MKPTKATIEIDATAPRNSGFINSITLSYEKRLPVALPEFEYAKYNVKKLKQKDNVYIVELSLQK